MLAAIPGAFTAYPMAWLANDKIHVKSTITIPWDSWRSDYSQKLEYWYKITDSLPRFMPEDLERPLISSR